MPGRTREGLWRRIRVGLVAAGIAATCLALRRPLLQVGSLLLGAVVLCFISAPIAALFEKKLSRPFASLAGLLALGLVAGGLVWLLLPTIVRELFDLAHTLPGTLARLAGWLDLAQSRISARLPGVVLPRLDLGGAQNALSGLAGSTVALACDLAEVAGRISMTAVLAYFLLCDRDRLLLRLELLLPRSARPVAVSMGNAVCRELRMYLRSQLIIASAVALISTLSLAVLRLRNALVLGVSIGILNMVPYFGPFIGGAPAVLIALGDSWQKALMTVAALAIVQQLDGSWISPRVVGSLTGFSPALVLLGIYAGAKIGGLGGMLFAMPVMMTVRTLFRVFVQKCENI